MATIGSIVIGMAVDSAPFSSGLTKVAKDLEKFGKAGIMSATKPIDSFVANSGKKLADLGRTYKQVFAEVGTLAAPSIAKLGGAFKSVGLDKVGRGLSALRPGFGAVAQVAGQAGKGLLALSAFPAAKGILAVRDGMKALPSVAMQATKILAGGALAATAAVVGLTLAQAKLVTQTGATADRLGTSTAALSQLHFAAHMTGSDAGALDVALQKMNVALGKAVAEGGPAAGSLERIGLKAEDLVKMDPTEAFKAIADGIAKVPTPAEKAALAMELFGKGGTQVLNTLNAGSGKLNALGAEFVTYGGSVTEGQRTAVKEMEHGFGRIEALGQGLGTQLAAQLAPFATAAIEDFLGAATAGETMGEKVAHAVEFMAKAVGVAADIVQNLRIAFLATQTGITQGIRAIVGAASYLDSSLVSVVEELDKTIADQGKSLNEAFADESWSVKVANGFATIKAKAEESAKAIDAHGSAVKGIGSDYEAVNSKVGDLEKKLTAEIEAFGKSGHEAEIYRLQLDGVKPAALANVRALAEQVEALNKTKEVQDKLKEDSKKVIEDVSTPVEKLKKHLDDLAQMKAQGLINGEQFNRGSIVAKADFDKENTAKRAGALEAGSVEARSAVLDFKAQRGPTDTNKQVASNTGKLVTAHLDGNKLLERLVGAVGKLGQNAADQAYDVVF